MRPFNQRGPRFAQGNLIPYAAKRSAGNRLAEAEKKLAGAGREVVYKTDPVLEIDRETRKNAAEILKERSGWKTNL